MHRHSKFLAVAVVAAAFAVPAAASGMLGGGGPGGAGPSGWGATGSVLPPSGGDGGTGPRGPSGPDREPGGLAPSANPGALNFGLRPPHRGAPPPPGAPPGFTNPRHGGGDWRRRSRRYWFGGPPIFVPEPSGDYLYGDDDYDDGSDSTGCWVFRKAYDRAGHFLGFVHVDLCEGQ